MTRLFQSAALAALLAATPAAAKDFRVTSPDLSRKEPIAETFVFKGFGCSGENQSPALSWKGAPADTKSFAVMAYDPDAPTGSGWWHWVVFNLPATTTSLPRGAGSGGALPAGSVQSRTDFGKPGYGGPCPPQGDKPHRYVFTVYALKVDKLPLDADASAAMVGFMVRANALDKASVRGTYGR